MEDLEIIAQTNETERLFLFSFSKLTLSRIPFWLIDRTSFLFPALRILFSCSRGLQSSVKKTLEE